MSKSIGCCELCGERAECNDRASKLLPKSIKSSIGNTENDACPKCGGIGEIEDRVRGYRKICPCRITYKQLNTPST